MQTGWLQLALYVGALALITKPLGLYLMQVLDRQGKTWLDPGTQARSSDSPIACMGVDPAKEQDWKQYTLAMLLFSLVSCLFTYAILRLQHLLPLNPQGLGPLSPHLAFNTAVSFTTNTNWQSYGGESTMSYFSQMVGADDPQLRLGGRRHRHRRRAGPRHRPPVGRRPSATSGSISSASPTTCCCRSAWCSRVFLVSQGMIQNFKPYTKAKLVEPIRSPWRRRTTTASR